MGQCMSRKAAGALAASAAVSQHNRPTKKMHQQLKSPDDDNNRKVPGSEPAAGAGLGRRPASTRGVAMSFGFRRRAAPPVAGNAAAARRLAAGDRRDRNGNQEDTETTPLTSSVAMPGRSTPRLPAPKREPMANAPIRGARFGFRGNSAGRFTKVADLNTHTDVGYSVNNNPKKPNPPRPAGLVTATDNNRNAAGRTKVTVPAAQIGKYTLQSTQLPKPEPIRVIETKTAKTLANNNRRTAGMYQHHQEETSSKDGSLTEDSGVGSHLSGYGGDNDVVPELERLDGSPTFGVRRSGRFKPRNLELVVTGNNKFDVRDLDDSNDSTESCPPPLPQLPSAFNIADNKLSPYQSTGIVRDRTIEYHKSLNWDNRSRKISITSSEGFSDDYGEEEKTFKDRFRSEKTFIKTTTHKTFLKTRATEVRETESSPPSSDEHDWVHGGEAMADDISVSMSSSDESRDKHGSRELELEAPSPDAASAAIGSALQSLMNSTLSPSSFAANKDVKSVLLTIEDPKFAAVAAASNSGSLLDDELLSPVESLISCSESEEIKKKLPRSSSNSKDVNEKLTPPSPGTPTNASNSLSLSDGKDDFLIDDEIADQPALVFEDGVVNTNENFSHSQNNSENNTPTIVDSTPKPKRRVVNAFEGSPLSVRNKRLLSSRAGSLDTLSPCESIASDDMMMDYEFSQSSGVEDFDNRQSYPSLNDTLIAKSELAKEWSQLSRSSERFMKSSARSRLLSQRASIGTPSPAPDSPRSLESRRGPLHTSSPARSRPSPLRGYDSDDGSVRLDRAHHQAIKQDVMGIKAMLLKLRRVLNESETHNPFESQATLTNGLFNSLSSVTDSTNGEDNINEARLELADLRRQVIFLQGQLEDKEKTVQNLQEQMVKLLNEDYHPKSAPASTTASDTHNVCNAATQTERIRPISAGPSLLNGSSLEGSSGSLVSATNGRSRPHQSQQSQRAPPKLWRKPGEPPSPPRYAPASSIPRRARSTQRPTT